mmetsp:Transcript_3477/g.10009  ORF Transcript_3477/g.10009 Transcript_3477/m.10009 type:complete len:277 (-) Transcript_3477:604-1434(-)
MSPEPCLAIRTWLSRIFISPGSMTVEQKSSGSNLFSREMISRMCSAGDTFFLVEGSASCSFGSKRMAAHEMVRGKSSAGSVFSSAWPVSMAHCVRRVAAILRCMPTPKDTSPGLKGMKGSLSSRTASSLSGVSAPWRWLPPPRPPLPLPPALLPPRKSDECTMRSMRPRTCFITWSSSSVMTSLQRAAARALCEWSSRSSQRCTATSSPPRSAASLWRETEPPGTPPEGWLMSRPKALLTLLVRECWPRAAPTLSTGSGTATAGRISPSHSVDRTC